MSKGCVFILSVSSDIGRYLASRYLRDGYKVFGTYRSKTSIADWAELPEVQLFRCDIASHKSVRSMIDNYRSFSNPWDIFISCVGMLEPIKPFFSSDFDTWEKSVTVNSLAQLRVLRMLWPYRTFEKCHAAFFAGAGTNGAVPNYSAYAASKIFLIKMCELLSAENSDLNPFILGPGFRPTKIHRAHNVDFLKAIISVSSLGDIYDCINWCITQGKEITGGRNFSVVHDPWRNGGEALVRQLKEDSNKFKLRRFRNKEG